MAPGPHCLEMAAIKTFLLMKTFSLYKLLDIEKTLIVGVLIPEQDQQNQMNIWIQ